MAVLKMWDGSQWLVVGPSTPAVASPLNVSGAGVIDIDLATATTDGSLAPADFKKLQHSNELLTGALVIESPTAETFISGLYNAYLMANLRWTGSVWNLLDTAQKGAYAQVDRDGFLRFFQALAGANPRTPREVFAISSTASGAYGQLNLEGPSGGMITSGGVAHFCANCWYDGASWWRHNTSQHAMMIRMGADSGSMDIYYAAPGTGAISWATSYALTNPATRPATAVEQLNVRAAMTSPWVTYGAPFQHHISRDPAAYVHLGGLVVKSGQVALNGDVICNLNAGFRPQFELIFNQRCAGTTGTVELRVQVNGNIYISTPSAGTENWVSLAGISYYAAG